MTFIYLLVFGFAATAVLGMVVDDDEMVVTAKYEGGTDVGITTFVGRRHHITHGAEGKAIAAHLPDDRLNELLEGETVLYYGEKKTNRKKLAKELKNH